MMTSMFSALFSLGNFGQWLNSFQRIFDKNGDGVLDIWQKKPAFTVQPDLAGAKTANGNSSSKKKGPHAENIPVEITLDEDTTTAIDLSGVKFKNFGSNRNPITIELKASEGTFDAAPGNKKLTVIGTGTDTLQLIGKRNEIQKYLKDKNAISYTGEQDDFGDDAATLSFTAHTNGVEIPLGETSVDITDVSDDQVGTPNADTLTGDNGRNTLIGLGSGDYLRGLDGDDSIVGDAGNDTILGGAGADTLEGGADSDVLQYYGSSAGVTVDLHANGAGFQQAAGGDAEGDVISGFENVYGSDQDDTIIGDDDRNILFGYGGDDLIEGNGGDDVIRGGEGADTLDGGDGTDWLRYQGSVNGVSVDLNADDSGLQAASDGDAEGDVISNFENVQGSDAGDLVIGNADDNYIIGFGGDDTIRGGDGNDTIRGGAGADTMDGGDDADVLQYTDSASGVSVDLNADASGFQHATGGDATGDVISGFEHVYATNSDDVLTGNSDRNILYGYDGNDTFEGGDGKDVFRGGAGADTFLFTSSLDAGNVNRIIDFSSGSDAIHLDGSIFTGLTPGLLAADQFLSNATGLAEDAQDRIIYDTATGHLYFDSDGSGAADGLRFATVSAGLTLDETDFFVF